MNYVQFGTGKDLIFLHGWGGSILSFLSIAKSLGHSYRVTIVDFAGFGDTPEPKRPMTVFDYADEVLEIMNKTGIISAILVGHSFGGRVALEIASKHSYLVDKLVLVSSAGLKPKRGLKYYLKVAIHKTLKKMGKKGLKGSSDFENLSPVMKETFKNIVNYDQRKLLKYIVCPTAIFWSRTDLETKPFMAEIFNKEIKDSALFWLDGGHFCYLQDRVKFVSILKAFIKS